MSSFNNSSTSSIRSALTAESSLLSDPLFNSHLFPPPPSVLSSAASSLFDASAPAQTAAHTLHAQAPDQIATPETHMANNVRKTSDSSSFDLFSPHVFEGIEQAHSYSLWDGGDSSAASSATPSSSDDTPLIYLPRGGKSTNDNILPPSSVLNIDTTITTSPFTSQQSNVHTNDLLFTVLTNYLSLGQVELSRTTLDSLFRACPEKVVRALRAMVFTHIPSAWLFSRAVPSAGHLAWLAYIEYKSLFARVYHSDNGLDAQTVFNMQQQNTNTVEEEEKTRQLIEKQMQQAINEENSHESFASNSPSHFIPLSQLPSSSYTPINPFGFISHDRLTVTLIEVDNVKLPPSKEVGYTFNSLCVRMKLDGQYLTSNTMAVQPNRPNPLFKHTFHTNVWYADSNAVFRVYACTQQRERGGGRSEVCIGEVSLPLHQIRNKQKYHIWLPLHLPTVGAGNNSAAAGSSTGGPAAAPVSSPVSPDLVNNSCGRIRLKLLWWSSGLVRFGDFSVKTRWLLETDLLMANAVTNHRSKPGKKLITPEVMEEIRHYTKVAWNQQILYYRHQAHLKQTGSKKKFLGAFDSSESDDQRLLDSADRAAIPPSATAPPASTVQLSDDVYRSLRRLIRALPTIGHALTTQLNAVSNWNLGENMLFEVLYLQIISEMMLRKEFGRACESLLVICKEIFSHLNSTNTSSSPALSVSLQHITASPSVFCMAANVQVNSNSTLHHIQSLHILTQIFYLFILFIQHGSGSELEQCCHIHMRGSHPSAELEDMDDIGASSMDGQEMDNKTKTHAVETYNAILDRKCKVYNALLGAANDFALKRFCAVEDEYLRGIVDGKGELPPFFSELLSYRNRKIESDLDTAGDDASSGAPADANVDPAQAQPSSSLINSPMFQNLSAEQQSDVLIDEFIMLDFPVPPSWQDFNHPAYANAAAPSAADIEAAANTFLTVFWRYYSNYLRITSQHIFEFPLKVSLSAIRLNQWHKLHYLLKPFHKLRILVVLLSWDEYQHNYGMRRQIIIRVWRQYKQEREIRRQQGMSLEEEAAEPKLIQWCNRLDVYVLLIDTLLSLHPGLSNSSLDIQNAIGCELLDSLRTHSLLSSFQLYLPDLHNPAPFLDLLAVHASNEEWKHDLHILKTYYSIRCILDCMEAQNTYMSQQRATNEATGANEENKDLEEYELNSEVPTAYSEFLDHQFALLQSYIFSMEQPHFQVLIIEKIFSLLFINEKTWQAHKRNFKTTFPKQLIDIADEPQTDEAEQEQQQNDESESTDDNGKKTKEADEEAGKKEYFYLRGIIISQILNFLQNAINQLVSELEHKQQLVGTSADTSSPLYPLTNILHRLYFMRSKVLEGIWRLWIVEDKMKLRPCLTHMVSPIQSMSTWFLQRDLSAEAHLNPPFTDWEVTTQVAAPFLAQRKAASKIVSDTIRWAQLSDTVNKLQQTNRQAMLNYVVNYIEHYHENDGSSQASSNSSRTLSVSSILQAYFLYMDSSLTFAHFWTRNEYVTLIQQALKHLTSLIEKFKINQQNKLMRPDGKDAPADEFVECGLSMDNLLFYQTYATNRLNLASNYVEVSPPPSLLTHPYSLDDLNVSDTVDSMSLEYGPFGFESAHHSTYTKWMNAHGIQQSTTPYIQKYKQYVDQLMLRDDPNTGANSSRLLPSPWSDIRGLRLIDYLATETANSRQAETLAALMEMSISASTAAAAAANSFPPSTFIDVNTNRASPSFNPFATLALQILPSLAAVRYVLHTSDMKHFPDISARALQYSTFSEPFHRWITARLNLYEILFKFHEDSTKIPFVFLSTNHANIHSCTQLIAHAKDWMNQENINQDQNALICMMELYADTFESLETLWRKQKAEAEQKMHDSSYSGMPLLPAEQEPYRQFIFNTKLKILELSDIYLDHPAHQPCVSLVDRLLESIICDECCSDDVRAKLILRVNDVIRASQWTLKYLQRWDNSELCTDVLLKCIAGLSTLEISNPIPLKSDGKGKRQAKFFDHQHRYDQYESSDDDDGDEKQDDEDDEVVDAGVSDRGGPSARDSSRKPSVAPSDLPAPVSTSGSAYSGSISDLRSSIEFKYHIILIYKQLCELDESAIGELNIYHNKNKSDSSSADNSSGANATPHHLFPSWQHMEQACNSNLTAVIINLIQHKLVDIAQKLYVLYKTYSRLYPGSSAAMRATLSPAELAAQRAEERLIDQHLMNQLEAASLASLLSSSSPTTDRIFAIKRLQTLKKTRIYDVGEAVLSYLDSSHSRYVISQLLAQFLLQQSKELQTANPSLYTDSPSVPSSQSATGAHTPAQRTISSAGPGAAPLLRRRIYWSLTESKERWFIQVHHATQMLVCLPEDYQNRWHALYQDPLAIMTELLKTGETMLISKIFPIFKQYCVYTASADDAFFFVLNFASRLLTLGVEELALDKEVGFAILDMCLSYPAQVSKVGQMCLIMCDVLSAKLITHPHPYLLLHLITAILVYVGKHVLPSVNTNATNAVTDRNWLQQYHQYVALCCSQNSSNNNANGARKQEEEKEGRGSRSQYDDIESKLAAEQRLAEDQLPLLYALVTTPLISTFSSMSAASLAAGPSSSGGASQPSSVSMSSVLIRVLGSNFSLESLYRSDRCSQLRDNLIRNDQLKLAKRVWKEAEHRNEVDWSSHLNSLGVVPPSARRR